MVRNGDSQNLGVFSKLVGVCDSTMTDALALLAGLEALNGLSITQGIVEGDSALVVSEGERKSMGLWLTSSTKLET